MYTDQYRIYAARAYIATPQFSLVTTFVNISVV
jgi:hypothetical protein